MHKAKTRRHPCTGNKLAGPPAGILGEIIANLKRGTAGGAERRCSQEPGTGDPWIEAFNDALPQDDAPTATDGHDGFPLRNRDPILG
jgi:hypothetical protein